MVVGMTRWVEIEADPRGTVMRAKDSLDIVSNDLQSCRDRAQDGREEQPIIIRCAEVCQSWVASLVVPAAHEVERVTFMLATRDLDVLVDVGDADGKSSFVYCLA